MPERTRKTASNTEINQGSILLLFGEEDAAIMRGWSLTSHPVASLPMLAKRMLKRGKDHDPGRLC
jgi:hypothetical protein